VGLTILSALKFSYQVLQVLALLSIYFTHLFPNNFSMNVIMFTYRFLALLIMINKALSLLEITLLEVTVKR